MEVYCGGKKRKRNLLTTKKKPLSSCSNPSNSSWLPYDVTAKILSLLPARSLQKFRCVCRSWNSTITQDPSFVDQHLQNRRTHGGILSLSCTKRCWGAAYYSPPFLSYSAADDYSGPVKFHLHQAPLEDQTSHYSITNSCDGLVGIFSLRGFYVVNPSIGKLTALPGESLHVQKFRNNDRPQAGIGFDASSGKYKAVRLFRRSSGQYGLGCEVCTMGGGGGGSISRWKLVRDAPFQFLIEPGSLGHRHTALPVPVLVNGAIHWPVLLYTELYTERGLKPDVALSFNLSSERFHVVRHPMGRSRPSSSRIVALGGRLCIADSDMSKMQMDVWVSEDCGYRKWVKQYEIDLLGMHQCTRMLANKAHPVTVRADGIVVLCDGQGRRDYYDPQTGCFLMHDVSDDDVNFDQLVTYADSLVWPWPTRPCVSSSIV